MGHEPGAPRPARAAATRLRPGALALTSSALAGLLLLPEVLLSVLGTLFDPFPFSSLPPGPQDSPSPPPRRPGARETFLRRRDPVPDSSRALSVLRRLGSLSLLFPRPLAPPGELLSAVSELRTPSLFSNTLFPRKHPLLLSRDTPPGRHSWLFRSTSPRLPLFSASLLFPPLPVPLALNTLDEASIQR